MKAAIYTSYGPPENVTVKEVERPEPGPNELLIRVKSSAVTAADARIRAARFPKGFALLARLAYGLTKPRRHILGSVFSGTVVAVGANTTEFGVGDDICGTTGMKMGTHAEYVVVSADTSITHKPSNVTHEDAAAMIFGGTAALSFLRDKLSIQKGDSVLVNGASGAVGTNAVQLATFMGADVTAVTSGDNAGLVKKIGAKKVIDYTQQDIFSAQETYDIVLDTVGNLHISDAKKLLRSNGRLALMVASLSEIVRSSFHKNIITGVASEKKQDIAYLLDLMQNNKLTAIIDSIYDLNDIVSAYQHVDSGKKSGNVILRMR